MAKELPYLPTYKNVGKLFEKIATAKIPEAFTHKFLSDTLGLKGSGDRALITLLKAMSFIDNSGKPTGEYSKLKNPSLAKLAIGGATKNAYAPLFNANENANTLPPADLRGLVSQVAGSDSDMTTKIAGTFNSLVKIADFNLVDSKEDDNDGEDDNGDDDDDDPGSDTTKKGSSGKKGSGIRRPLHPEFHYNIQIHLPSNATEETYLNIFNALRKSFQ